MRQQEALIGISQFIVLPLQFLSSAIMDTRLRRPGCSTSPATTRSTGRSSRSREALSADTDWGAVWPRLGCWPLLAL